MRKVFLEELPKNFNGVDWIRSKNHRVKFIYDDVEGYIELLSKCSEANKIYVKYNGKEYKIKTDSLLYGEIGFLVGKLNNNFKYDIGEVISNNDGNIKIIDCFRVAKGNQKGSLKYYTYKCLECGNEARIYESNIKKGYGCVICSRKHKKQEKAKIKYNEVKKYIKSLGMELLSKEYIDAHSNLKVRCKCGNVFERTLSTFKGTPSRKAIINCPTCNGVTINTYEKVKEDLNNHKIKLLDNTYINRNVKMKIKYEICGHELFRNYYNIQKSDYKCPKCIKNGYGRNTEQLKNEINDITNREYSLLSEYKTMNDKVTIKHNKCGNIYEVTPHNFLDSNNRCPKCGNSKGETETERLLKELKINYESQYVFDDLLSDLGNPLRFDFAIFDKNNNLSFLYEYDGEFHYRKIYKEHDFEGQVYRDNLKNEYCKNNNIELLRIPYWEFNNIENILKNKLKEKGFDN